MRATPPPPATTTPTTTSACSASPAAALLRWLFGVRPTTPGFATVVIQPQPGDLPSGNATLPSLRGPIAVAFTQAVTPAQPRAPSQFTLKVSLPGAVVARVCLPLSACVGGAVLLDGARVAAIADGAYACVDGVGAGAHSAACPATAAAS